MGCGTDQNEYTGSQMYFTKRKFNGLLKNSSDPPVKRGLANFHEGTIKPLSF